MALQYLIDECSVAGELLQAIQVCALRENLPVDFVCVGGAGGPPSGTLDPQLINWAIAHNRTIISQDVNTLVEEYWHAVEHLRNPPPLMIIKSVGLSEIAEWLVLSSDCYGTDKYGQVIWVPESV